MGIIDLVYPKKCVGCGRVGEYICGDCWKGVKRVSPVCPSCGRASLDGWRHRRCEGEIERLIAPYQYKGLLQKAIKKVKYRSAWGVIDEIGENWARKVGTVLLDCDAVEIVVSSVPMYRPKMKSRGFNQAERLARRLARELGLDYREMLERKRETKAMYGLSKEERGENVKGAFGVSDRGCKLRTVNCPLILLVDDVWTTGSTMRECARVLRQAGVEEVWGVVVAR